MFAFLIAVALAAAAPSAAPAAQTQPDSAAWQVGPDRLRFVAAGLDFPRSPGGLRFVQARDFSRPGTSLDTGLIFESSDGRVFATVYVYYPGMAHAGLTTLATDWAIHTRSPEVERVATRLTAAGGHENAAIRSDYRRFDDDLVSSAAFVKLDRWMVKFRVSGPAAREADVNAAMTALLDGLRLEDDNRPAPPGLLAVDRCEGEPVPAARALADDSQRVIAQTLVAGIDGGGQETEQPGPPLEARLGAAWCQPTRARVGDDTYLIYRARDSDRRVLGRSAAIVPINDAGRTFELVELRDGVFALMHHDIGRTDLLGTFDGPLSDEQIVNILTGSDEDGGRIRATIELLPSGGTNIVIRVPVGEGNDQS